MLKRFETTDMLHEGGCVVTRIGTVCPPSLLLQCMRGGGCGRGRVRGVSDDGGGC